MPRPPTEQMTDDFITSSRLMMQAAIRPHCMRKIYRQM
jgi:hypothetical protein